MRHFTSWNEEIEIQLTYLYIYTLRNYLHLFYFLFRKYSFHMISELSGVSDLRVGWVSEALLGDDVIMEDSLK
jgi:hypothetical protein